MPRVYCFRWKLVPVSVYSIENEQILPRLLEVHDICRVPGCTLFNQEKSTLMQMKRRFSIKLLFKIVV